MVVPVIPARHKYQNELQFQLKRLSHHTHCIKTKKSSPDLIFLTRGMIFLIVTEFKLLAIIHFLMETWRTDTGVTMTIGEKNTHLLLIKKASAHLPSHLHSRCPVHRGPSGPQGWLWQDGELDLLGGGSGEWRGVEGHGGNGPLFLNHHCEMKNSHLYKMTVHLPYCTASVPHCSN